MMELAFAANTLGQQPDAETEEDGIKSVTPYHSRPGEDKDKVVACECYSPTESVLVPPASSRSTLTNHTLIQEVQAGVGVSRNCDEDSPPCWTEIARLRSANYRGSVSIGGIWSQNDNNSKNPQKSV